MRVSYELKSAKNVDTKFPIMSEDDELFFSQMRRRGGGSKPGFERSNVCVVRAFARPSKEKKVTPSVRALQKRFYRSTESGHYFEKTIF